MTWAFYSTLIASLGVPLIIAVMSSWAISHLWSSSPKFPVINVKEGEWTWAHARKRFLANAGELLRDGLGKIDGPFCMVTDSRTMIYLPPHYADYIKNDKRFSFSEFAHRDMMGYLPGFDPFGSLLMSGMAIEVTQKKISPAMDSFSGPISNTMGGALRGTWGEETDFHQVPLQQTVLSLVARVTARVFVGPQLCEDPDWLRLSITYTVDTFLASKELGRYPWPARWIVQWFNVRAQHVRASLKEAYRILDPIIAQRKRERAANGGKGIHEDAIEWYHQVAGKRRYDEVIAQLGLALAAIHTTGDLLFKTIGRIADHPDIIRELRKEIAEALSTHGVNKTGVFHMPLLDSVIKETQRLDAVALAIMNRYVKEDVTLPNGIEIPKGSQTSVITDIMRNEKTYGNAQDWDPYRFYNLRRSGQEQKAQLVSATAEHLAFGFGKHACPGRFLAAHELKIMLAHILLKYDIEFMGGDRSRVNVVGTDVFADDSPRVQVRRVKGEEFVIPQLPE